MYHCLGLCVNPGQHVDCSAPHALTDFGIKSGRGDNVILLWSCDVTRFPSNTGAERYSCRALTERQVAVSLDHLILLMLSTDPLEVAKIKK